MASLTALNVAIHGFSAVNTDLEVELRDPISKELVKTAKPYSDGTVRVPQIAAGAYELAVIHPQLIGPVLTRPIRVLPAGDTNVTVLIDPSKFRSTPIEDVPDANLGPVRDTATSIAETILPLQGKVPGEAIKAEDFNLMASSIRDLALSIAELTRLVSPLGHNHPELETKFDEVTTNFETLLTTLSTAMAELQRQIQAQRMRTQIEDLLDRAEVDKSSPQGRGFLDLVDDLDLKVTAAPTAFGRAARNTGVQLATQLESLIDEKAADDPEFVAADTVKALAQSVDLLKAQKSTSYDAELEHHLKVDRTFGGGALKTLRGGV
jgi:signal transduction histidine kinase